MAITYIIGNEQYMGKSTDDLSQLKPYIGSKIYLYDTKKTKIYNGAEGWVDYEYPTGGTGGGSSVITDGSIITSMFATDAKAPLAGISDSTNAVTAAKITDATATGKSVLTAASKTAARTAIGAGTSSLALGTTSATAKAGDYKPASTDISDATAIGKSLIVATDKATARTAIGAGTSNLALGTTSSTAKAGNYVPTWAQVTGKPTTFAPVSATSSVVGGVKQAVAQADSVATDVAGLVTDFNTLLANLRTAGIISAT